MYRIDNAKAATVKPARGAAGPKPNGYWTIVDGVGTTVDADFMNALQEELANLVTQAGLSLDKTDDTQIEEAVRIIGGQNYALFKDQKADGVDSAVVSSGWNTREIQEVTNDIDGMHYVYELPYDNKTGTFQVGETVTGGTSNATAIRTNS